jgi:tape measure domain-containing protein
MAYTASSGAVISFSVDGAAASQRQIDNIAQSMGSLSNAVQGAMRNLAAGIGIGGGLMQVVETSDAYTKLTSQLHLATQSQNEYVAAYAAVKRISNEAQSDLAGTGVLYARIANGTRELGINQRTVADITEVVNLSLKTSGATAEEAASAQLQLSQAFASGTLRGEEYNAVNEAAPRLMKALADGIGVPVGALKDMASNGKITADVMATVLPKALSSLRDEASQVQTISGALQVLKNNVMEFTAVSAQSNGTVAVLTGGISLLANNVDLLARGIATMTAAKVGSWAAAWVADTYKQVTASAALRAANIAQAESEVASVSARIGQLTTTQAVITVAREETVAKLAASNANIAAAETAIAAATAAGAQSFALRTLRLATAELTVAEAARSAMLAELAMLGRQSASVSAQVTAARLAEKTAQDALNASTAAGALGTGLATRALGLLGGPVGAIITVLGLAATAWSVYGNRSEEANRKAAESTEASTPEIIANLEKQNVKLRERLALIKQGQPDAAKDNSPGMERMASILGEINGLTEKSNNLKKEGRELDAGDQAQLYALGLQYSNLTQAVQQNKSLKTEIDSVSTSTEDLIKVRERLSGVDKQYLADLTTLHAAREKSAALEKDASAQLASGAITATEYAEKIKGVTLTEKEYVALASKLATETYKKSDAGKAATSSLQKEESAYTRLITAVRTKTEENRLELAIGENATESQKLSIKLTQELTSGKLSLSSAHEAVSRSALKSLGVTEQELKLRDAQRDLNKWIAASTDARKASAAGLAVEYALYGQSVDAREIAMVQVRAEADAQKKLDEMRAAGKPVTEEMISQINAETAARVLAEQATLAQGKALQYASQLAEENKKFGLDYIADDKQRAAAALSYDAQIWRERIRLAGDGTEAQRILQQNFDSWYQNQSAKPMLDEQKRTWDGIESAAHDAFLSMENGAKSARDRIKQAIGNGLFEWLWQLAAKPIYLDIRAAFSSTGASISGVGDSVTAAPGAIGGNPLMSAVSAASGVYKAISGGFAGLSDTVAGGVQSAMTSMGHTPLASQGLATASGQALTPLASMAGRAAGMAGGYMAGSALNSAISGKYETGSGLMTTEKIATAVASYFSPIAGAIVGGVSGLINRAFGMGDKETQTTGISGSISGDSISASSFAKWHQDGGWFRSDKDGTDSKAFSSDTLALVTNGLNQIKGVSSAFAASLGVDAASISDYAKSFSIDLGKDGKIEDGITKLLTSVGDELATKLVPNILQFSKTGETAASTLERLAGDFDATTQMAQLLGKTAAEAFGAVGIESAAARERLVDLAGSASNLTSLASSYAQSYLTEAEKLAPVKKAVEEAMASLGLASVTTRDQFKQVVTSLDLTTDAGAKQFTSMMQLADAFAQVHPAAESISDLLQIQGQIYDALGDKAGAAAVLEKQHVLALQGISPAMAAATKELWAAQAAAEAISKAQSQASGLMNSLDTALSSLQSVVTREKTAIQTSIDVHTASVTKLQSLSQSLHSTLDSLKSPDDKLADRAVGQAQIRAALAIAKAGGPLPAADSLKDALSAVTQDASSKFSSYTDYLRDLYQTQNDVASLAGITDDSLSVEEKSLDALNAQVKQLDLMVNSAQAQVDILKGSSTTLLSISQALSGFQLALVGAQKDPINAATAGITNAYQTSLGRTPDAAGMEYWTNQAAAGQSLGSIVQSISGSMEAQVQGLYKELLGGRSADAAGLSYWVQSGQSIDAIRSSIKQSDEYKKLHPFAIGTNFIPEDMPALVHKGERIIPAADNRALFTALASPAQGNAALLIEFRAMREENRALREEVKGLRVETRAIAGHTERTSRIVRALDGDQLKFTTEAA